ncbi:senescence-associated carboxylesterase 101-like [Gastrolobium bilobum]|uniref:senescence-associated carboxylesterase 101-like n=1 Tax=Gastrolobium bilobum TaxID=150636 RepID=UPI002AAFF3B0|nr:senescence-associated carboxylesterase 101-like [Gastrolobium bilobum]
MRQSQLFSSGIELAPFMTSSVLLQRSWDVISSHHADIVSNVGVGLSWKVYKEPVSDLTIIAFEATLDTNLQVDLVSHSDLRERNFLHFDFLCTKNNPFFSINNTAVSLFYENRQKLYELKSEINSSKPLIITGNALGGSVASLFTISRLDSIGSGKNRPLCITFGSPLIGDKGLQQAISRSSNWNSCFLHVVSHKDPLPRLLITNHSSQTSSYMPFGTFLFCSDKNSTCFENPDSILEVLVALGSIHDQNQEFQSLDYGNIVENLYHKAICKDFTVQAKDMNYSSTLHASIHLHLWALGFTPDMQEKQHQNIDINTLVTMMETLENKFIFRKRETIELSKKLNLVKIDMAQLEWYKKDSKDRNIGYYDSYKKMLLTSDQDVVKFKKNLINYWEKMVEEAEMKPQKEGSNFRTRWLGAGTNYRRMVEPLVIAKYYSEGGKDYATEKRSKHFKLLDDWLKEGTTKATCDLNSTSKMNVEALLTIDSCFWAHVEEALLMCKLLKDAQSSVTEKEEACRKLLEFEEYVYGLLKNYAVSIEIFLKESSYMIWWNEYKAIKGTSYDSPLSSLMNNAENYNVKYAGKTYNFC